MLKRILSLVLSIIMIAFCFASCTGADDSGASETVADTEAEGTASTAVKIIYAAGSPHKKSALKIQDKIMSLKGSSLDNMNFCTVSADNKTEDDGTFEILLGETNRSLSADAKTHTLGYLDFAVMYDGNKIAIYSNSADRMVEAAEYVAGKLSLDGNRVVYSGDAKYIETYKNYAFPDFSISAAPLSEYSIIYSAGASNSDKDFAEELGDWLMSSSGLILTVADDSAALSKHEILIGKTNRAESTDAVAESIEGIPYSVVLKNGKLAIISDTKVGYGMALTAFKNAIDKNNGSLDNAFGVRNLTYDEIREITVGCPNIQEKEDGLYFYKCSDTQMEAYKAQGNSNAIGSTGIRLDFVTDSSTFSFTASVGTKFELYVNGVKDAQISSSTFTKSLDNSKGANRLTLFLPNHGYAAIKSVQLDIGATCKRQQFDGTFLLIGDSITQGYNTPVDSMAYAHVVSMHYNLDSIVYGVGGTVFDADKLEYYGDDFKPDYITVAYGTNDWARNYTEATLRSNMRRFLNKLREIYPDATIIGITPIWRSDCDDSKFDNYYISFEEARNVIAEVYEDYGITCIDGYDLVSKDKAKYADEVHPNTDGFIEYAENLIKKLDKLLFN